MAPIVVADTNERVTLAVEAGAPPSVSLASTLAMAALAADAGSGDDDVSSTALITNGVGATGTLELTATPVGFPSSRNVPATVFVAVSILVMVLNAGIVTNTFARSGVNARSAGVCCWFQSAPSAPRSIQPNSDFDAVSIAATIRPGKK